MRRLLAALLVLATLMSGAPFALSEEISGSEMPLEILSVEEQAAEEAPAEIPEAEVLPEEPAAEIEVPELPAEAEVQASEPAAEEIPAEDGLSMEAEAAVEATPEAEDAAQVSPEAEPEAEAQAIRVRIEEERLQTEEGLQVLLRVHTDAGEGWSCQWQYRDDAAWRAALEADSSANEEEWWQELAGADAAELRISERFGEGFAAYSYRCVIAAGENTAVSDAYTPAPAEEAEDTADADESVTEESVMDEPAVDETAAEEPVADETVADEPAAEEPVADETVADEPAVNETVTDDAVMTESVTVPDAYAAADESTVEAIASGITLNTYALTLGVKENFTLIPSGGGAYSFESSDKRTATVDADGLITGKRAGEATITVSSGSMTAQCIVTVVKAPSKVTLSQTKLSMGAGQSTALTAELNNGNVNRITFSSSNEKVAVVDENGLITSIAKGSAKITAKAYNGKKATCTVTVLAAPEEIYLNESSLSLPAGMGFTLEPSVNKGAAAQYSFTSSNTGAASVDKEGKIAAHAPGKAVITVSTYNGLRAECIVNITPAPASMWLEAESMELGVKESAQLVPANDQGCEAAYSYASENAKIATVDKNGLVTAKKAGSTTITVTAYNGLTAQCAVTVYKAPSKVTLSETKLSMGAGQTESLSASINSGSVGKISFSSSKEGVATVDENGLVTAISEGKATITAKAYNGKKASCTVTVLAAPESLSLAESAASLPVSMQLDLKPAVEKGAMASYSFASSNEAVASVDSKGVVTAKSIGTAVITVVTYNGLTAACEITVTPAPAKLELDVQECTLGVKETFQLSASTDFGSDAGVSFASSKTSIATVSADGLITAKKVGSAVITATTFNGVTAECTVTVKKAPSSISINMKAITLTAGSKEDLEYQLSSGSAGSVSFSSSDESVARVDEKGLITAVAAGVAKITVQTYNGKKASCTVTVEEPTNTITALRTEGNTAIATVTALQSCELYVEVLDENSEELLMHATAPVDAGLEMEEVSAELPGALPAHYILRAVLQDEEGNKLCMPYTTRRYTTAYQEFEEQSPSDFPADRVLDMGSVGYAVYSSTTYPVSSRVTESKGKYTFVPPAELAPGYVVIIDNEPIKIKTINYNPEGTVTITEDPDIYLADIYDALHLDDTIVVQPGARSYSRARSGGVDLFEFAADISYGPVTLQGKTSMTLNVRAFYDKNFFGADYFEYETYVDAKGSVTIDVAAEFESGDLKNPPTLPLFDGEIPTAIPGITATVEVEVPIEIEAKAGGKIEAGFEVRAGFNYDPVNGKRSIESTDMSVSGGLEGKFEVKAGPKIAMGVKIVCLEGEVSGMAGVKVEGELKGLNTDKEYSTDKSRYHACLACVDMELAAFAEFEGAIKYEITKKIKGDLANLKLFSSEWEIGDAFLSIANEANSIYGGMPKLGAGDCQNMKYRVRVHTQDVDGLPVYGKPVNITGVGFKQPISLTGESTMEEYLYSGSYTASVQFSEMVNVPSKESFTVYDAPLEVVVGEGSVTVKGTITDGTTKKPIGAATVLFEHEKGSKHSATTDEKGQYQIENLAGGKYKVTVSAEGYEPKENIEANYQPFSTNTLNAALTPELPDPTGNPIMRLHAKSNGETLEMGGWSYDDAIVFTLGYQGDSTSSLAEIAYNFQGKYSSMSFDAGYCGGWERDAELTVIADGVTVIDKAKLKYTDIARPFTINLSGVHKLVIHFESHGYDKAKYAIGDIRLTKAGDTLKKPIECMENYDERRYLLDAASVVTGDFSMGGYNYRNGYDLKLGYPWNMKYTGIVGFNFRGQYSTLSFDLARYESSNQTAYPRNATVTVEVDGVPVAGYNEKTLEWNDPSMKVSVNVSGASQVLIKVTSNGYENLHWRIGNVHYS